MQGDADGVSLHHVSKTYGLATVLQVEDLVFPFGKVVGLVGENGAGKSTLLGILAGTVAPNPGGDVSISGQQLATGSPIASQAAGVAMVSQEFPLVGQLNVTENLTLGNRPKDARRLFYDKKATTAAARRMLAAVGLDVDPRTPVSSLSIPTRQMLEVAKALGRDPRLLILDEPTSALGPTEADAVIRIAREHAAAGGAVIFVGHRLEEVTGGRRPGGRAPQRPAGGRDGRRRGDRRAADQGDGRGRAPRVGDRRPDRAGAAGAGVHRLSARRAPASGRSASASTRARCSAWPA